MSDCTILISYVGCFISADPRLLNFQSEKLSLQSHGRLRSLIVICRAYGNTVAPNLIDNLSGPKWAKTIAYLGVFIQVIVSFNVYASPIFEAFDTKYGDEKV